METSSQIIPCFLCQQDIEIKSSKRGKPYLVCNSCGIQTFIRGKKGIKLFSDLITSINTKENQEFNSRFLQLTALQGKINKFKAKRDKIKNDAAFWELMFPDKNRETIIASLDQEINRLEAELHSIEKNRVLTS
jgi:hypothetical protein